VVPGFLPVRRVATQAVCGGPKYKGGVLFGKTDNHRKDFPLAWFGTLFNLEQYTCECPQTLWRISTMRMRCLLPILDNLKFLSNEVNFAGCDLNFRWLIGRTLVRGGLMGFAPVFSHPGGNSQFMSECSFHSKVL
jgi:hypothetical protein